MSSIEHYQKEAAESRALLERKEHEFRVHLDDYAKYHQAEMENAIQVTAAQLQEQHANDASILNQQLEQSKKAYMALEEEFRKTVKRKPLTES